MKNFSNIEYSIIRGEEKNFAEITRIIEGNSSHNFPTLYEIKLKNMSN